jgi:hypothetical protein
MHRKCQYVCQDKLEMDLKTLEDHTKGVGKFLATLEK